MRKKAVLISRAFFLTFFVVASLSLKCQEKRLENDQEMSLENNFVPDSTTAIKIAEAIWLPIYGDNINKKKPFVAELISDTIWEVKGTLQTAKGGVPYIQLSKSDGRIIKVYHTK